MQGSAPRQTGATSDTWGDSPNSADLCDGLTRKTTRNIASELPTAKHHAPEQPDTETKVPEHTYNVETSSATDPPCHAPSLVVQGARRRCEVTPAMAIAFVEMRAQSPA